MSINKVVKNYNGVDFNESENFNLIETLESENANNTMSNSYQELIIFCIHKRRNSYCSQNGKLTFFFFF